MKRRRIFAIAAGSLAAFGVVFAITGILTLRSPWFHQQVRIRILSTIQEATGGRAELASYTFDWRGLRAVLRGFVLRGNEPAGKPPLFRADSITIGLKIVSLVRRDVDIRTLDIQNPRIYLIVYPGGTTNIPRPRIPRKGESTPFETLLNLAVGRFSLQNGLFEVEGRASVPFDARGRHLDARFAYEFAGPRYLGNLSIEPLNVEWAGQAPVPFGVRLAAVVERDRITVSSGRLATGESHIDFSGALANLVSPRASFRYDLRASGADAARLLRLRGLAGGAIQAAGTAGWAAPGGYSTTGNVHAFGLEFRRDRVRVANFRADGAFQADAAGINLSGVRLAAEAADGGPAIPVAGSVSRIGLRGRGLDFRGLALALLGGRFTGEARLDNWDRLRMTGELSGLEMKRAVAFYSPQPLPWNSLVSGPLEVEGSLAGRGDFRIRAKLMLAPAPQGPPVRGQIAAAYDSGTGALDLGRSTVILPASRAEFSGAAGQQLQVHFESRDLNDFLPVLGESAGAFPLRLENGSVVFDGTVTGRADRPRIDGHVSLARFSYSGRLFDSLAADLHGSPRDARLENATLVRGSLRARFQFAVSLDNWRVNDGSAISGSGAISGSALPDVASLIGRNPPAASGTVNAAGEIAGTVGSPRLQANLEITKGALDGEPFDRFAARLNYAGRTLQVAAGRFTAGAKQVLLDASFEHSPAGFQTGRLRFDVRSNVMSLDQIATLGRNRPGVQGTLQLTASGAADLMLVRGAETFRLAAFEADVTGRGLQLTGQALGDAHLTAHSQGAALHVDLVSNFADSDIRGQGDWRLEGDYPGTATLTFAKLDLVQLRRWITPGKANGPARFIGSAAGELRLGGPALKPELLSGELRLPTFSIGPAPGSEVLPGAVPFALKNSGPIVATYANSALTVQSARLVGRSTDVTVSGRMLFRQKDPLDLKITGRLDLGVLQDFRPQIKASGAVSVDASVRGALDSPDVNGRVELKNAALDYGDFPNGIENANGVIAFAGDRATIQTLSAETGGGKIRFFGFAGYSGGDIVFRLHANADAVRIRYPAGVSTQVNASLNFSGTPERSQVAGTVTVLRTSLNLQSDFSSLLAQSAQPVRVPSSSTGFPGGMNFDIQIQTAPDIQFESSLTQDLEADANLRLSGTVTNPALLGRINFTQGQVVFFGTKYTINQGSISFFNPVKIDPILNVDLETRARGIDITLSVTGPLNKLNMTPRSDPPLQFNEIVALLATGQTPSEQTLRGQQSYTLQPFQQSAASALLGQAIASPVSGRLQRFFGISKVRIDPTLPGVEYNPQARLTIQQQVTPDVTFTYITNVTSANPQVVSMEWAVNKKWSVVAQREENGMLGLDFFYKRQFK